MKKKRLIPKFLLPGDKVGIVAPASHFDKDRFYKGIRVLESLGFQAYLPEGLFEKKGYLAGSDIHRATMFNSLFADDTVSAIFCARGGFGSLKILPLIDYELIRKNPKILVGFSDISAVLSTVYKKCGLVAFHGPMITTLADADQRSINALQSVISSPDRIEITLKDSVIINPGICYGTVLGGNLTTLCHLSGTPYQPDFKGSILFIEENGEAPYRIDRMLTQMKMAGCFDDLAGLILCSFESCGAYDEIISIVEEIIGDKDIPVITGIEAGHGKTNITIPTGMDATLDTTRGLLTFHESVVRYPDQ